MSISARVSYDSPRNPFLIFFTSCSEQYRRYFWPCQGTCNGSKRQCEPLVVISENGCPCQSKNHVWWVVCAEGDSQCMSTDENLILTFYLCKCIGEFLTLYKTINFCFGRTNDKNLIWWKWKRQASVRQRSKGFRTSVGLLVSFG